MRLDVRLPIGMMFTVMGLLLAGYGAVSDRAIYARSLGINVNLVWGLVLIVAGAILLLVSARSARG